MKLKDFDSKINSLLSPEKFDDFCPNGRLVDPDGNWDRQVHKVVTGVSLCDELIAKAAGANADVLIVHHPNGFWKNERDKRLVGTFGRYMAALVRHGIILYGYHLPLDAHEDIGNNVSICWQLCLDRGYVGRFMEHDIGVICKCRVNDAALDRVFPKGWSAFGPEPEDREYTVGICSGSGTSGLQEAADKGCDMFITGEVRESTPIFARENGITVISAGHHRTETFGVKALAERLSPGWGFSGVNARFIDVDNPV